MLKDLKKHNETGSNTQKASLFDSSFSIAHSKMPIETPKNELPPVKLPEISFASKFPVFVKGNGFEAQEKGHSLKSSKDAAQQFVSIKPRKKPFLEKPKNSKKGKENSVMSKHKKGEANSLPPIAKFPVYRGKFY